MTTEQIKYVQTRIEQIFRDKEDVLITKKQKELEQYHTETNEKMIILIREGKAKVRKRIQNYGWCSLTLGDVFHFTTIQRNLVKKENALFQQKRNACRKIQWEKRKFKQDIIKLSIVDALDSLENLQKEVDKMKGSVQ